MTKLRNQRPKRLRGAKARAKCARGLGARSTIVVFQPAVFSPTAAAGPAIPAPDMSAVFWAWGAAQA